MPGRMVGRRCGCVLRVRCAPRRGPDGAMMWTRRKTTNAAAAVVTLAGLATGAVLVFSGCARTTPPRPALASWGAPAPLLPYTHGTARIVDLYDGIAAGYYRGTRRIAPYNLYATTRELLRQAPGASKAHDIGFRFGPPPPGGKVTRSASVSYPAASFGFTWSAAKGPWLVSMDGVPAVATDGGAPAPPTRGT